MRYFIENRDGYMKVENNPVDHDGIESILNCITQRHLPKCLPTIGCNDDGDDISLPNENYPLHVGINVALEALKRITKYEPDFFNEMDEKYE